MTKEYQNKLQDERITNVESKFDRLCDYYNHQITAIKEDIAYIKANQKTLMWFMFAIIGALIGLFFK
jgi:uncharacterized protein YdaL